MAASSSGSHGIFDWLNTSAPKKAKVQHYIAGGTQAVPEPQGFSHLATRLLEKFASGLLSGIGVKQLAADAVFDGLKHPEVKFMANTSRPAKEINQQFLEPHAGMLPEQYMVKVTFKCPKTHRVYQQEIPFMLGHEWFAKLAVDWPDKAKETLWSLSASEFWDKAKHDPAFAPHWLKGKQKDWGKAVPLRLHGDGVRFTKRSSLMILSLTSFLCDPPKTHGTPKCHFVL
jgi:hypothetical protein